MSQKSEMKEALLRGESFTRLEALQRFNTVKAPARIAELRQEGLPIETEMIETLSGKHVARWYIKQDDLPGGEQRASVSLAMRKSRSGFGWMPR